MPSQTTPSTNSDLATNSAVQTTATKSPTAQSNARPNVLIDCDPGNDDVFAIALAAKHANILAITSVAGNSSLENTTRNALLTKDLFGLNCEVHPGARTPLSGVSPGFATQAHGRTGLDGPEPRTPLTTQSRLSATEAIIETVRSNNGIWIIATGPLTNIAIALEANANLVNEVAGISWMGGSSTHGNVTPAAEFNAYFDPQAAQIVLNAKWRETLVFGLNLTHQVLAGSQSINRLIAKNTVSSIFCAELLRFSNAFAAEIGALSDPTQGQSPMHDPCAVLGVTHRELFTFQDVNLSVETQGEHTKGMTHVDSRPWMARLGGPIKLATKIDSVRALELIEAAVI